MMNGIPEICRLLAAGNPLEHVVQFELFRVTVLGREIAFTNHMFMMLLAAAALCILLPLAVRRKKQVPRGFQNAVESLCVFIREDVARPALGDHTDRFVPYLWTVFFFILSCNVLGMIPLGCMLFAVSGGDSHLIHLDGAATANIWMTGTLAVCSFFMIHISGIRQQGIWHYIKNFIPHVPLYMVPMMYVLELIGSLVKPFSLAVRLFANMLGGHTVLAALLGLILMAQSYWIGGITIVGCAGFAVMELFVAFLQAYIFTFLTTLFIGSAIHPEH